MVQEAEAMDALGALLPEIKTAVPGEACARLIDTLAATECPALTMRRARRAERSGAQQDPIVWTAARGANVLDADANRYVDLSAGFGAASIGHGHPRVVHALRQQAGRLLHALGDLQPADVKVQLLQRLAQLAPFPDARVMLGLSGADAVEAALKTALLKTGKPGVIAFEGGYHGLHHGPLAACGYNAAFREPFAAQLNPHVRFVRYPDTHERGAQTLAAVEDAIFSMEVGVGAVLVEPVLGRGGVVVPPDGFLRELSALCRRRGVLLIADEIMTGLLRTGSLFSSVTEGAEPDLICLGKALGGGLPVSACLGKAEVMQAWGDPGNEALHTATFFGHPLGAVAALATLDVLQAENLGTRALSLGEHLRSRLTELRAEHTLITDVRGKGLLIGVEVASGALGLGLGRDLLARGFITVPAGADARVISLTPPLTITQRQLDAFADALGAALEACA